MPRLRRGTRERRQRPEVSQGVWEWLSGQKTYEQLATDTKWEILILETHELRDIAGFWRRLRQAVEDGQIEVNAEREHYLVDAPLLEPREVNPKSAD